MIKSNSFLISKDIPYRTESLNGKSSKVIFQGSIAEIILFLNQKDEVTKVETKNLSGLENRHFLVFAGSTMEVYSRNKGLGFFDFLESVDRAIINKSKNVWDMD